MPRFLVSTAGMLSFSSCLSSCVTEISESTQLVINRQNFCYQLMNLDILAEMVPCRWPWQCLNESLASTRHTKPTRQETGHLCRRQTRFNLQDQIHTKSDSQQRSCMAFQQRSSFGETDTETGTETEHTGRQTEQRRLQEHDEQGNKRLLEQERNRRNLMGFRNNDSGKKVEQEATNWRRRTGSTNGRRRSWSQGSHNHPFTKRT